MHLIHCTKKLLGEMKLTKEALHAENVPSTGLGNWYANLFRASRYKCLMFTNEMTLYSFFIFRVGKKEITKLKDEFHYQLQISLKNDGIPEKVIHAILKDYMEINYAKTQNRSTLGSMNDMISQIKFLAKDEKFLDPSKNNQINHKLNRIPMKANEYEYAIDKLHKVLEFRYR